MVQAIEHKGFSFIDAMSPCVMFNNTQEAWKELVTDVDPDHNPADRTAAFDLALRGGFKLGILYRELRPTLDEKYAALIERTPDSDIARLMDSFSARKGAAIAKPAA